jgi:hypothetical protein
MTSNNESRTEYQEGFHDALERSWSPEFAKTRPEYRAGVCLGLSVRMAWPQGVEWRVQFDGKHYELHGKVGRHTSMPFWVKCSDETGQLQVRVERTEEPGEAVFEGTFENQQLHRALALVRQNIGQELQGIADDLFLGADSRAVQDCDIRARMLAIEGGK